MSAKQGPLVDVIAGLRPLHRTANVDDPVAFARLLTAVCKGARGLPVVFPVHPRTAKTLQSLVELDDLLCR